mmetsp:Transcript_80870/g.216836  ORF Transcript_80870/g.216836 Transcript_80870/m.216836 type:complete len:318 (+) Transcript_80870:583-1536(+)
MRGGGPCLPLRPRRRQSRVAGSAGEAAHSAPQGLPALHVHHGGAPRGLPQLHRRLRQCRGARRHVGRRHHPPHGRHHPRRHPPHQPPRPRRRGDGGAGAGLVLHHAGRFLRGKHPGRHHHWRREVPVAGAAGADAGVRGGLPHRRLHVRQAVAVAGAAAPGRLLVQVVGRRVRLPRLGHPELAHVQLHRHRGALHAHHGAGGGHRHGHRPDDQHAELQIPLEAAGVGARARGLHQRHLLRRRLLGRRRDRGPPRPRRLDPLPRHRDLAGPGLQGAPPRGPGDLRVQAALQADQGVQGVLSRAPSRADAQLKVLRVKF